MSTAVKERSIRLYDWEVRAVLNRDKRQLRRVVKLNQFGPSDTPGYDWHWRCKRGLWQDYRNRDFLKLCPYGQPGDRLWARETWLQFAPEPCGYEGIPRNACIDYRADFEDSDPYIIGCVDDDGEVVPPASWRPSVHMPRWASRITLEVTNVRVERLQSISEADAIAEDIIPFTKDGSLFKYWACDPSEDSPAKSLRTTWRDMPRCPIEAYRALWQSINGPDSWDANPWVWVVEFKQAT